MPFEGVDIFPKAPVLGTDTNHSANFGEKFIDDANGAHSFGSFSETPDRPARPTVIEIHPRKVSLVR